MGIVWNVARAVIVAVIVVAVAELSKRHPRYGALLLSLPIVSILAIFLSWFQHQDLPAITRLSRETLVLVPLGLAFFVPFALAARLGIGFGSALAAGLVLATLAVGGWLLLGPSGST